MARHSHWASIKHKKGALDAKRGKLFSKLAKHIMTAARHGGGDPEMNLRLRYAIDKARAASMPRDNIERAVKKGTGELEGEELVETTYEGYGPGGVAVVLDILTDNKNRTAGDVRKSFELHGGKLSGPNTAARMFEKKGLFSLDASAAGEDQVLEIALDAGAEDMEKVGNEYEITCAPQDFEKVRKALEARGLKPTSAELGMVPLSLVPLSQDVGRRILALMEELEDHEDVQNVYANFTLPPELLAEAQAAG